MTDDRPDIRGNLENVRARIADAADRAGRNRDDIRLIAVSKYMPPAYVEAAMAAGQHCFGENTVQDARLKATLMQRPGSEWHFIGHLQSGKAKYIPGSFDWLHTLDSLKLADRLSERAERVNRRVNVLVQVNIAADPDKQGLLRTGLYPFLDRLLEDDRPGIRLRGLMTIGQRGLEAADRRSEFVAMRELATDCAERYGKPHFSELSMGMSADFDVAIEEGATMVRVGSGIFGPRPVKTG